MNVGGIDQCMSRSGLLVNTVATPITTAAASSWTSRQTVRRVGLPACGVFTPSRVMGECAAEQGALREAGERGIPE